MHLVLVPSPYNLNKHICSKLDPFNLRLMYVFSNNIFGMRILYCSRSVWPTIKFWSTEEKDIRGTVHRNLIRAPHILWKQGRIEAQKPTNNFNVIRTMFYMIAEKWSRSLDWFITNGLIPKFMIVSPIA